MDRYNLNRFLESQTYVYEKVISELRSGVKKTHWMWYIFPQIDGLGKSETARWFAIKSIEEARDYLTHQVLGERLRQCAKLALDIEGKSVAEIFGYPDNLKFHSCITLFSLIDDENSIFEKLLDKYFGGQKDPLTLEVFKVSGASRINTPPDQSYSLPLGVFARRVAKFGKKKCGDSFAIEHLEKEQNILLVIADGVSSSPCDWKASETACEALLQRFKSVSGTVIQRMENAAEKANDAVRQIRGNCAGSITSLTFVVLETSSEELHVLNIGDSRVYLGPDDRLEQITSDDVHPVILKRNGENVLQAGVQVFMRGVTRSLGQLEALEYVVSTHKFKKNYVLLLVSDGISKNEAFTSDIPSVFASAKITEKFAEFVVESSQRNNDDATLIAVWHTTSDQSRRSIYEEDIATGTDFRSSALSPIETTEFIKEDLVCNIVENRNEVANELLDYADKYGLKFERTYLEKLLSQLIKQNRDRLLVARIRDYIRRT